MLARDHSIQPAGRRRHVVTRVVGVAAAVGSVAIATVLGVRLLGDVSEDEPSAAVEAEIATATATTTDLILEHEALEGSIRYAPALAVAAPVEGTVLDTVGVGATLANGDVLVAIDDMVVVWLEGDVPAWRALESGDEGIDVLQLETALVALGFDPDGEVTVDREYTSATAELVERWQESLGVEETGRVEFGSVVFGADRTRVAAVDVSVGAPVAEAAPLLELGSTERSGTFTALPEDAVTLALGDAVDVGLVDRTRISGVVVGIVDGVDAWTIEVALDPDAELPSTDIVQVTMSWSTTLVEDAVTVPSSALLRLDGGGYVVDVIADDGTTVRTAVTIGVAVGTRTEIIGGLAPGAEVLVL